jgi:hypothetical protein
MTWVKHDEDPLKHIGRRVKVDYDTGEVIPLEEEDKDVRTRTHEVPDKAEE